MPKSRNLISYQRSFDKRYFEELNFIGNDPNGGFSSTTFGTSNKKWTVRGENMNAPT